MAVGDLRARALSRRGFVGLMGLAAASTITGRAALALPSQGERRLGFYNLHTGESFEGPYWAEGTYIPDALTELRYVLRDFRTGEQHEIDRNLLDLLVALRTQLETWAPFQVISGYRSPKTNAMLREESHGVAAHSYHMVGKAIDIRVEGRSLATLHNTALALGRGGVGYYPASDFVHVDVGPVRRW